MEGQNETGPTSAAQDEFAELREEYFPDHSETLVTTPDDGRGYYEELLQLSRSTTSFDSPLFAHDKDFDDFRDLVHQIDTIRNSTPAPSSFQPLSSSNFLLPADFTANNTPPPSQPLFTNNALPPPPPLPSQNPHPYTNHRIRFIPDTQNFFADLDPYSLSTLTLEPPPPALRFLPKTIHRYPCPGINPPGDRRFTADQLVTMDALYTRRISHSHATGELQAWALYTDEFKERFGWRPAQSRFEAFSKAMGLNPTWYFTYGMETDTEAILRKAAAGTLAAEVRVVRREE